MTKRILILTSNPRETTVLDIDIEMREIRETLRRSENRDQFSLEFRVAVRPKDLRRALLEVKPNIVHFCGHGTGDRAIVLEDEIGDELLVRTKTLTELFKIVNETDKTIECLIFNACYSEVQAKEIVKYIRPLA
ncbi:MAG: CHAT domain-containing protein [Cyanobacteria bacterium P01_G01_bin.39]